MPSRIMPPSPHSGSSISSQKGLQVSTRNTRHPLSFHEKIQLKPGSSEDFYQRLEECRYKLMLLDLNRRKTENELRLKFGVRFKDTVKVLGCPPQQSNFQLLLSDFVWEHIWVSALLSRMKMINPDNQFCFVETLLEDWMEAIKKGFSISDNSRSYLDICESLRELGGYCRVVSTAIWSALQFAVVLSEK